MKARRLEGSDAAEIAKVGGEIHSDFFREQADFGMPQSELDARLTVGVGI